RPEPPVEDRGNRAVQHGIAEELEPLVMIGAEAAVSQRPAQQLRVAEGVTEAVTERVVRHPSTATSLTSSAGRPCLELDIEAHIDHERQYPRPGHADRRLVALLGHFEVGRVNR